MEVHSIQALLSQLLAQDNLVGPEPLLAAKVVRHRLRQVVLVVLNPVVLLVPALQLRVQLVRQALHNRAAAHNITFLKRNPLVEN